MFYITRTTEAACSNAAFPIQKLPVDVMAEIFNIVCEDYRETVRAATKIVVQREPVQPIISPYRKRHLRQDRVSPTPVILSQVCRYWKEVAYSWPRLWDTVWVKLECNIVEEEHLQVQLDGLNKWLTRSGSVPLIIKVGPDGRDSWSKGMIWYHLAQHIQKCKIFDVYLPDTKTYRFMELWKSLMLPLPHMEVLVLRPYNLYQSQEYSTTTLKAGNLTSVTLNASIPVDFRLSRITEFRCWHLDCEIILKCLRNMDRLETCFIAKPRTNSNPNPPLMITTPTPLACVQEFVLFASDFGSFGSLSEGTRYIMQSISLPAVRKLSLSSIGSVIRYITASVHYSELPSPLESLIISVQGSNRIHHLLDLLSVLPALVHLEINDNASYISPTYTTSMPKLECLTSLSITSAAAKGVIQLFKDISMPLLKELEVSTIRVCNSDSRQGDQFISAIQCYSSDLRVLKLTAYDGGYSEANFLNLLGSLNQLECLHILSGPPLHDEMLGMITGEYPKWIISSGLFEALGPPRSSSKSLVLDGEDIIFLPRLAEFSLDGIWDANAEIFIDALEYRWKGDMARGIQKLKSVRIFAYDCNKLLEEHDIMSRKIESLVSQGMDFVVSGYAIPE
ncbi:hypothetical protein BDQ17DRAFT_1542751 [Cyathus striatus]|nr:hypothetical protein BDQ17DRAFT_1542751 [Cyathus striatus]